MKEETLDLVLLSINTTSNCYINTWSMLSLYQASYTININPSIFLTQIFYVSIFFNTTSLIGSTFAPQFFYYVGFKGGLALIILLNCLVAMIQIYGKTLPLLYLCYGIYGLIHSFIFIANNLFLYQKYSRNMFFSKQLHSIRFICALLWGQIQRLLLNPKNEHPLFVTQNNEKIFHYRVVKNFPLFVLLYNLVASLSLGLVILLIKEPSTLKGSFFHEIKSLFLEVSPGVSFLTSSDEGEHEENNSEPLATKSLSRIRVWGVSVP